MKRIVILALTGLLLLTALPGAALAQTAEASTDALTTKGDGDRRLARRGAEERPATSGDQVPLSREVRGLLASGRAETVEAALEQYWTPERMRKARPAVELPIVARAAKRFAEQHPGELRRRERTAAPDGPEERVDPAPPVGDLSDSDLRDQLEPPSGDPVDSLQAASPDAAAKVEEGTAATASASVLASWQPGYSSWHATARTNGKVFFTKPGVGNFVCSGAVVNSAGKDTVWTAGHCVHDGDGGGWHTNWTFVPAYDDGYRPYGTWSAKQLWTMTSWMNDSDFTADMGVAIMHPKDGQHIVSKFGGHGISWNYSKNQNVRAFGYPAEAPFDGGDLTACDDGSWPEWSFLWVSSDTLQIACDMTRGSSGGPWLRSYDGNYGYLNGVNSRINRIVGPTRMYSPYFDDTAKDLYNATKNL